MSFYDILRLSLRNLREAKLRATLTSMGVIVGVAVIVTMVSFGLGLQRNMLTRFRALDLFNEMRVFGKNVFTMATAGVNPKLRRDENPGDRRGPAFRPDKAPTRILDDAAVAEIQKIQVSRTWSRTLASPCMSAAMEKSFHNPLVARQFQMHLRVLRLLRRVKIFGPLLPKQQLFGKGLFLPAGTPRGHEQSVRRMRLCAHGKRHHRPHAV